MSSVCPSVPTFQKLAKQNIKWNFFIAINGIVGWPSGSLMVPVLFILNLYLSSIRDAIITCVVNTGTCLFAGFITFSILGHMAHNQGSKIEDVVASGPGLVFITYPEVVLKLPGGPIWAITFFFMLVVSLLSKDHESNLCSCFILSYYCK